MRPLSIQEGAKCASSFCHRRNRLFRVDFVNHYPFDPNVRDLESYKKFIAECCTGMPDIHVTIEDMIAEGDR